MRKVAVKQKTKKIHFSLKAENASNVSLVGEFNNWNPDADPMQRDENGTWAKKKMLPPGNIEYKYWVDGKWVLDPYNLRVCQNFFES